MSFSKLFYYLIGLIVISFLSACDTKEDISISDVNIIVRLQGIENNDMQRVELHASNNHQNIQQDFDDYDWTTTPNFDVLTTIKSNNINTNINKSAATSNNNLILVPNNHYYRLIITNDDYSTIYYNEALRNGGPIPPIMLISGRTYKWFAYTVSSSTLSALPELVEGKLLRASLKGRDFAFAKGTINPLGHQKNYLDIILRKMTARFKININTLGLMGSFDYSDNKFAKVVIGTYDSNTKTFTDLIKYGDFNILSSDSDYGTFTRETNYRNNLATDGTSTPESNKYAYIYTAALETIQPYTLAIKLVDFKIRHYENNAQINFTPNNEAIIIPLNNKQALPLAKAFTYDINVRLVESPIIIGDTRWARTNLYYIPDSTYQFVFRYNNYTQPLNNEYWYPGSLNPNSNSEYNTANSPCSKVFPLNMWKEPTAAQLSSLQNNILNLPFFGFYNLNSNLEKFNEEGHYWSSYSNSSNSYSYLKTSAHGNNIISSGINLSERRLIRCVRAK